MTSHSGAIVGAGRVLFGTDVDVVVEFTLADGRVVVTDREGGTVEIDGDCFEVSTCVFVVVTDGDIEFATLDSSPPTTTVPSDDGDVTAKSVPELAAGPSMVPTTAVFTVDAENDSDVTVPLPQAARTDMTPIIKATGENFTTSNYEL